ncbi:undecaprenyl-diphosphate phosphatase [Catenovulum sp. SM1970]|uniref:undecaprenyl-diphosphate phosphatase n=1 Tax=Marinifaba aquimaris TaxID=2741323 RepID=UPI001571CB9C|nr:undecaprenyl-diphosphate phosphatase [Marinifaba aquimaris]NTS78156.1 undecaprenyl-diphosphate phosphatase [Marinifaba aquimaris]
MSFIEILVLAIIQGITEFLPISSSAHLILPSQILGWEDQGTAFDVAVHFGSLLAVVIYFRQQISEIFFAWCQSLKTKVQTPNSRLGWSIIVGTIPGLAFGLAMSGFIETYARSPWIIATTTIVFGLLLWYADAKAKQVATLDTLNFKTAMIIGLAQAVAVIPGTSRSGITMTAGLLLGLTRDAAARFSFLLSIPIILAATLYYTMKLVTDGDANPVQWEVLWLGIVLSFISAYACIHFFLKLINSIGMLPFVIYRLALGVGLVAFMLWA